MVDTQNQNKGPMTTGQVAEYCHVSHRAVLKWVEAGKLKAYRTPGKHSRVSEEDFVRFLKEYNMPVPAQLQAPDTRKKILIVDDDRGIVHSLQRVLKMNNTYVIETAYNGFEAGKKFAAFKPDFIILDIRMPGLDGYEVCANIRSDPNNSHIKILILSGINEPQEIQRILDLGANDFMHKPFKNDVLQEKVRLMLG